MIFEIAHRDGTVVCRSSLPFLGYGWETLKDMDQAGYLLLTDGRKAKFPTLAQWKEAISNG